MKTIQDKPLLTDTYSTVAEFIPNRDSVYIYGLSGEERSDLTREWTIKPPEIKFVLVSHQSFFSITLEIDGTPRKVSLRSAAQLHALIDEIRGETIYIDITGLSHHVWAPLLKASLRPGNRVVVVYVEPLDYSFSASVTEGEIFDLSERISGIAPIPGFAMLSEPRSEEDICFVPLLGFEGTRFAYLLEEVQPPADKIFPVVGVPGFRPEYPFYTYHGNKQSLLQTKAWKNVQFAAANCPFSMFYKLQEIADQHPHNLIKVAPIGTKPHALGAVLFALANPRTVELVYDHPIRKANRTTGASRLLAYNVSALPLAGTGI